MSNKKPMHGSTKAVGCSHLRLGNFCKLFPNLPSWAEECDITNQCDAEWVASLLGSTGGIMHDVRSESGDSCIPAAYTFFAQFIDHDITLDTRSSLHGDELDNEEVSELPNLRSASLDLDCVYGLGPEAMPFLFDQDQPGRLDIGSNVNGIENKEDVPRNDQGRALIGDPRNDENIFVSQLQLVFLKFHNRRIIGRSFEEAQLDVRYHYQAVVLHDFLKRVCDPHIYNFAVSKIKANAKKAKKDYPFCSIEDECGRICMPVEFSVAAYRFGHTLVRSQYPVNTDYPVVELFDERFGTLGFGQVPPELVVDWRFLLDVEDCAPFVNSKAVDHLLADELIRMPDPIVGRNASPDDRSLAFRNLLRGYVLGLPTGQSVAQALCDKGYKINPNQDIKLTDIPAWSCLSECNFDLVNKTPLFLYLMREAGVIGEGMHLGPVGSAILMEVFAAMLLHCDSFITQKDWKPDPCSKLKHWEPDTCIAPDGHPTLADIVGYVS